MPKSGGAPAKFARREVLNGILYVLRTGCAWRELPHDLPPWETVYGYLGPCLVAESFPIHSHKPSLVQQWGDIDISHLGA